ncbi:hypothetical protein NUW58_g6815 [Xylaria curta]|uniref:Uncharacterized protein n=1 Tax=Xylaria curta TaxID=42375 RepID=A0ACC1NQ46_9PEZI|nr:hypothetical protein NUW58_g6815 [Xylaria curta]
MAADERTPLLANGDGDNNGNGQPAEQTKAKTAEAAAHRTIFGPANRILLAGFLMSFTLGITQVPIVYVFRLMECDIFYTHNPSLGGRPTSAATAARSTPARRYSSPCSACRRR